MTLQAASSLRLADRARAYLQLIKPGIIMGNGITAAGGFALASKGSLDLGLFFFTLVGLSLIIASACAFNNYIDRDADKKMARTQNRPLARGDLSFREALFFASVLGIAGALLLTYFVNLTAALLALIGFAVYVFFYSHLKYRTVHGTLIGSIAGAVPPAVGYCAVTHLFDGGAFLLFLMIALWQMPHFFAIAIYRLEDYAAAQVPVLPLVRGMRATKVQMVLYVIAFVLSSAMLSLCGYAGTLYLVMTLLLGGAWLFLSFQGFKAENDTLWGRKMFLFSLINVTALCAAMFLGNAH
jgi:protoheme IX farnesyltransferase